MADDHGWVGRGKVRLAHIDGAYVLRLDGLTTQGGRVQRPIRDFLRKHYGAMRPRYADLFAVTIWIETPAPARRLDVDNVAKACLDAFTGALWRDDSQVVRLSVEKLAAEAEAVTLHIRTVKRPAGGEDLADLLAAIETLPKP